MRLVLCLFLVLSGKNNALDNKEQADHCRNGNVRPPCVVKSEGGNDVLYRTQRDDSEQRSYDVARTAGEHRAADDGGSKQSRLYLRALRTSGKRRTLFYSFFPPIKK